MLFICRTHEMAGRVKVLSVLEGEGADDSEEDEIARLCGMVSVKDNLNLNHKSTRLMHVIVNMDHVID